jgi:hypothetical protein
LINEIPVNVRLFAVRVSHLFGVLFSSLLNHKHASCASHRIANNEILMKEILSTCCCSRDNPPPPPDVFAQPIYIGSQEKERRRERQKRTGLVSHRSIALLLFNFANKTLEKSSSSRPQMKKAIEGDGKQYIEYELEQWRQMAFHNGNNCHRIIIMSLEIARSKILICVYSIVPRSISAVCLESRGLWLTAERIDGWMARWLRIPRANFLVTQFTLIQNSSNHC